MLLLFHSLAIPFVPFLSALSLQTGAQALALPLGGGSSCMYLDGPLRQTGLFAWLLYPHTRPEINPFSPTVKRCVL